MQKNKRARAYGPVHLLRERSIKKRFFLAAICLCVIPLILTAGIVFVTNYQRATEQYLGFSRSLAAQTQNNLESRLLRLRADAIDLAYNREVQNYVFGSETVMDKAGRSPVTEEAANIIVGKFGNDSDAAALMLFTRNGRCCYSYSNRSLNQIHFSLSFADRLLKDIDHSSAGVWGFADSDHYEVRSSAGDLASEQDEDGPIIFYSLKMKHLIGAEYVGYLVMIARQKVLRQVISASEMDNMNTVYLLDQDGRTILSGNGQALAERTRRWLLPEMQNSMENHVHTCTNDGLFAQDYAIIAQIPDISWYVVCVVNGNVLSSVALRSSWYVFLLAIVVLILMVLVFSLLSNSVAQPVNRILRGISYVEQGHFEHRIKDTGHDEFALIADSMDGMSEKLQQMIIQIRKQEQLHSETQIELLQMQINPHFINNTLNCVAGMAAIDGEAHIEKVVTSLASLLNQTLRSGREFVTLADELSYIRWYMDIQQYRGAFTYHLDIQIPDNLMGCLLPPFTLEPLIENSVTHGTTQHRGSMTITIKSRRMGNVLQLLVIDNGCGMTSEQLEMLNEGQAPHTGKLYRVHGIGIANVRKRIRLFFGESYGLEYDSVPGQFTVATVTIPIIEKKTT